MNKSFIDLESIMALLPGHVYWLNRDNVYQGCNEAQARSAGLKTREEIVGKRNKDLPWNKGRQELAAALDATNKEVMESGIPQIIEEPGYLLPNSTLVNYVSHKVPLRDKNDNIIGLLGVSIDITHQKVREESLKKQRSLAEFALENILANMPGHVYWKNKEGVYLGCNDRQAKSLGLNRGMEVVGKTDYDLPWRKGMAEVFRRNDLRVMETAEIELVEEVAQVDGKESIVLSQKTPIKNQSGEVVGVLGISIDITQLKETERMLKAAKEKAEVANQAKTDFLAVVSHELRTPLTGILGVIDILCHEKLSEKERAEYLDNINTASRHLLSMINNVLDFSKLEENKFHISPAPFDLHEVLEKAIDIMRGAAEEKGLSLRLNCPKKFPYHLIGDAKSLLQIFLNIIGNAIKFTDKGSINVLLEFLSRVPEGINFRVTISDTGIGIPKDKLEKIFERFEQVESSYTRTHGGSGLGLSVAKKLLMLMKGKIKVESELGQGSKFIMDLQLPVDGEMTETDDEIKVSAPSLSKYTVLLVEDDPLIQFVHKHKLEKFGCKVLTAANSKEVFSEYDKNKFDVIFMDIGLPDMSGNEIIQTLRLKEKAAGLHTPMIALTAYSDDENHRRSLDAGADDVLCKPVEDQKLQEVFEKLFP